MKNRFKLPLIATLAVTGLAVTTSCGRKKKSSAAATTTDTVAANAAALAYPTSLAISAFPASTSTALTAEVDATDGTGASKIEEQAKILRGEAASCVPKVMAQADKDATTNSCYEFDQDMIYGTGPNGTTSGTVDGKDSAKEACLVGFARARLNE